MVQATVGGTGKQLSQAARLVDVRVDCEGDLAHAEGAVAHLATLAKAREYGLAKLVQGESGDLRTLAVDYDGQEQGYLEWWQICPEMCGNSDPDETAVEGPMDLDLAKDWWLLITTPNCC